MAASTSRLSSGSPATASIRRVALLLNSTAGAFSQDRAEEVRDAIAAAFARHGVAVEIISVDGEGLRSAAEATLRRAKRGQIDAIVVGGGDGSIRSVASVLQGSHIPLGVLPLGTRNHFAKDLGIPLDGAMAAAAIAEGRTSIIDLAEVNGEVFINNSSIGIYPYMVIDRERRRATHKLAKWRAMVPAFFRMLRHFPRRRLRIRAEGWAKPYRTPCLFVGNNEYGTELFMLGRRESLDSGKLWLYVVKPRSPLEFFWMVCRLCFGHMNKKRDLDTFQLSEAEIDAKSSRLPVAFDGEVRVMRPPLHYRSKPRALRVIVSAGSHAASQH